MPSEPRHCERSKAIQGDGLPRLDCFAASRLAMTTLPVIASGPRIAERTASLRAKRSNPG
ncbi:MAG: hypothetical protein LBT00_11090 [Spirochaetaceae bacterium]|nr:hypothetical protein [Spirochaetaceae bacterium]